MFLRCITMNERVQKSRPDISCVSITWLKLISVTGPDGGRKMMDEECLRGNHVTQTTEPRRRESVSNWRGEEGRGGGRKKQCVCVSSSVCVWWRWQNKRPPLSCMALRILRGFRAPSARGRISGLSLELPVCLFPHRRLAKQQGPPPLPRVRSLSTPGELWSDGQKKGAWEGFGNSKLSVCVWLCVECDVVADREAGGWSGSGGVKGRCPSRLSWGFLFLAAEEQPVLTWMNIYIHRAYYWDFDYYFYYYYYYYYYYYHYYYYYYTFMIPNHLEHCKYVCSYKENYNLTAVSTSSAKFILCLSAHCFGFLALNITVLIHSHSWRGIFTMFQQSDKVSDWQCTQWSV